MSNIVIDADKFAQLYEDHCESYVGDIEESIAIRHLDLAYEIAKEFDDLCHEILEIDGGYHPELQVSMRRSWLSVEAAYDAKLEELEGL